MTHVICCNCDGEVHPTLVHSCFRTLKDSINKIDDKLDEILRLINNLTHVPTRTGGWGGAGGNNRNHGG